jgi:hypothetical protein
VEVSGVADSAVEVGGSESVEDVDVGKGTPWARAITFNVPNTLIGSRCW